MKKVLLSTLLMLLPLLAYAENVEVDGIRYNLIPEENEAEVAYNNSCYYGNIIIPDKVIHEGVEYSVKRIGSEAFYGCTGLLSVFIPNSVISIEDNAFKNCSSLTTIDIPNSVTSIGREAFNGTAWYNNQPDGLVYAGKFAYNYKGKMPDNTNISI